MSEKSRALMMKPGSVKSSNSSISMAPGSLSRGASLKAAYEAANYPTNFVAIESDFDNSIIITCPPMPAKPSNAPKKPETSAQKASASNVNTSSAAYRKMMQTFEQSPTCFTRIPDSQFDNPYIVSFPPMPSKPEKPSK